MRMQLIHSFDDETAAHLVRARKPVLVAGRGLADLAKTCRDIGLDVEEVEERYDALAAIADDPGGYSALMLASGSADEVEAVQVSVRLLHSIAPRVLAVLVESGRPLALSHWTDDRWGFGILNAADAK